MDKNKIFLAIWIFALLIGTFITLISINHQQESRSHASPPDQLEAESGVRAGNAIVQTDSNASGGNYVALGINTTGTPTPTQTSSTGLATCTALDKGRGYIAPPALSMPGYLQTVIDPTFGTKITRVTGDAGTTIPNVSAGTWRSVGGPIYSKLPTWNADQSLLLLSNTSANGYLFLNGSTYQPEIYSGWGPANAVEVRWHPTNPDLLVYVNYTTGATGYWNVRTNTIDQRSPGIGLSSCGFGPYEGNVSRDGNRIVVNCGTSFYAIDLSTGSKISPTINAVSDLGFSDLDWASISPNGDYIVASQNSVLNKSLSFTPTNFTPKATWNYMGHYDLGIDTSGNEVAANSLGYFVRLSDGAATNILSPRGTYPDYHTSTRNVAAPGWMYASLEGRSTEGMDGEIVAMELTANGRLRRLTNARSTNQHDGYDHNIFGSASPDGKRVFYRSDWGNPTGSVYGFVVDTRNVCP